MISIDVGGSGRDGQQLRAVPPVQRQLHHLMCRDDGAQFGCRRLHRRAVARMVYSPGMTFRNAYAPLSLVLVVRSTAVLTFISMMCAFELQHRSDRNHPGRNKARANAICEAPAVDMNRAQ